MTESFTFWSLVFFTEVTTTRFFTVQSIVSHQFTDTDEVFQTQCLFEFYVQIPSVTRNTEVAIECLADFLQLSDSCSQRFLSTTHTYEVPHDETHFLMDRVNRTLTLDVHQLFDTSSQCLFSSFEFRQVCREAWNLDLVCQVVLDCVRQYEVTVCQTLHQCRCTQAVCTVVREVSFTDSEETLDRSHQFVVYPNTTHCIVDSREDHHRSLIWIFVCNFFVHVEQVTVTSTNYVFAQAVDSVLEVQEYSETCIVHTVTSVATFLSSTRSNVTRNQVTECRITAFQVEVAVFVSDILWLLSTSLESLSVFQLLRNPDTTVVTQRFRHQSQLRLLVTVYRYTSRVNLSETWVSEVSTLTVALHSSRTVTAHSVC